MDVDLSGLRIITVATGARFGEVLLHHAAALRDLGADSQVWCLLDTGPGLARIADIGIPTRLLNLSKHSHNLKTSRTLARELAQAAPDWVHAHTYETALHACRAKAWGAIPNLVITYHDPMFRISRKLFLWPYRNVPDRMLSPAASFTEALRKWHGHPPGMCRVLEHTLEPEFFQPLPRDESLVEELGLQDAYPIILWVSLMRRQKGHADLLHAMPAVLRRCPQARLVFVGGGKHQEQMQALARKLKVADAVVFAGTRRDVPRCLGTADIFACPSHAEGCCTAVMEAMAAGKPIVSTRVWGPVDYMQDEVNGLLTPIGDSAAMAEGIVRLAEDRALARRLAAQAQQDAHSRFSYTAFRHNIGEIYAEAIAESRRAR